ncbi:hypothetical protein POM88_043740 [Heracleum sosnowskyi]|uniref:Protein LNK1 n=1 Tax=Heracleum sosnowskyi TaxID=360622 RepID=A0AAD8M3C4_9APIA|nr:hypothetical protein POM88_043740 [Heracleum sosnowskyi]
MSDDLSTYELGGIWDDFCHIDDHIVPHSRDENSRGHASQSESCKKPRIEVSTADEKCPAKCFSQEKEEIDSSIVNLPKLTMSESGMWTYQPDGTFSVLCDGDPTKELATIASANTKTSSSCFQSHNSASLENDLSYLDIPEDESSDLLYYDWDDVGFEDVFRNCDSLFNLQSKSNNDEIDWLSASNAFDGSESASRMDFASTGLHVKQNPSEDLAPLELKTECSSANDTDMTNVPASNKTSPPLSEVEDTTLLSCISVANTSNEIAEIKDNIVPKDQECNKREAMINDHVENGDALCYPSDLWIEGKYLSSEDASHNNHTTICVQQHKENLRSATLHHLRANVPCIQSDCHQPSDQTTVSPSLSGTRSENNTATYLPQKESPLSFEGLQDKDCSQDLSSMVIDAAPEEGQDKPCHYQGFLASFNSNAGDVAVASICNTLPVQSSNEFGNHNDVEGASCGIPAGKAGPWYVQESPIANSGINEGSLEATSFRQLQQVMEQLDLRTKLCIRDSLYRLARSAEQRHNNGGPGGDRDARTFMVDGTNKSSGYIDIEADTNPIDRSVAHLLFHRPSVPLPSKSIIPASVADPPIVAEKNNESATEMDRKVANL